MNKPNQPTIEPTDEMIEAARSAYRTSQAPDAAGQMRDVVSAVLALVPARPNPTKTGSCELELSFACTGAGYERLDPRDMLAPETSFRTPKIICLPCYELAADHYIREVHS